MEVVLQWLDDLDDLVFGLALLWEPLRRRVLLIGLAAALLLGAAPIGPILRLSDAALAVTALGSVLLWLIALLLGAATRRARDAVTA